MTLRQIGAMVGLMLLVGCGGAHGQPAALQTFAGAPVPSPEFSQPLVALVSAEVNRVRAEHGLSRLADDTDLARAAAAHSGDQITLHYIGHISPEGRSPTDRVATAAPTFVGPVGENIYAETHSDGVTDPAAFARRTVQGWLDSPGHRANLLKPDWTQAGVGIGTGPGAVVVTQVYATGLARLRRPLPATVPFGTTLIVEIEPLSALPGDSLAAVLELPNRKEICENPNGTRSVGACYLRAERQPDGSVRVPLSFTHGRGAYRFLVGPRSGMTAVASVVVR